MDRRAHPFPSLSFLCGSLGLLALHACQCQPVEPPPVGDVCGTGTIDGAPWALDADATRAVIVVHRKDGAGCGIFHSHVVNAKVARMEYSLDSGAPAEGSLKVTIAAAGLEPDAPELRAEFLPDGENEPLSDGDRTSIRGSVAEEVLAAEHPELVFTFSGLSASDGAGTASMRATIAGASSDEEVQYTAARSGERITVSGSGTLDGTPFGMPRNSLGFCIEPVMDIAFDLVLVPAATAVECVGAPPPEPWQPRNFADDGCAEQVGYNDVRRVAVRSCAGCHANELRLGATVPLVTWEDWRVDSIRNQGRPLFETAHAYVHLDASEGLSMPPIDTEGEAMATPLTAEELALFDAWVADGARKQRCNNDPGVTTFADRDSEAKACDDVLHYTTPGPSGATAKEFFESYCAYCHLDAGNAYPQVPQVSQRDVNGTAVLDEETFNARLDVEAAARGVLHPYYIGREEAPLSFWEASVLRVEDLTMPPNPGASALATDPAFTQFKAWVEAGAAPGPCGSVP